MAKAKRPPSGAYSQFYEDMRKRMFAGNAINISFTGEVGNDGSDEARSNFEMLKAFKLEFMGLHGQCSSAATQFALLMAIAELNSKMGRRPEDARDGSGKVWRAVDAMWCAMRASDNQVERNKLRSAARRLCAFGNYARSEWAGLA